MNKLSEKETRELKKLDQMFRQGKISYRDLVLAIRLKSRSVASKGVK